MLCPVREVQRSEVNEKMRLQSQKKGKTFNQGFHQRRKVSALLHGQTRSMQGLTVALTKPFGLGFEHVKDNA